MCIVFKNVGFTMLTIKIYDYNKYVLYKVWVFINSSIGTLWEINLPILSCGSVKYLFFNIWNRWRVNDRLLDDFIFSQAMWHIK